MKVSIEQEQVVLVGESIHDGYRLGRIAAKLDTEAYDYGGWKKLRINFPDLIEALAK